MNGSRTWRSGIDERFENLEKRIDERFEHVEQRLERVEFDVKGIQKTIDEKMLNKTTFFTFMSIVAGLPGRDDRAEVAVVKHS